MTAQRQQGQTIGVDFAISLAIFLTAVSIGIYYTNIIALPSSPFSSQIQSSTLRAIDRADRTLSWSFTGVPVAATSPSAADWYPLYVSYDYPADANNNSIIAHRGGTRLPAQVNHTTNTTLILANLTDGTTRHTIMYSDGTLPALSHLTAMNTSTTGSTVTVTTADMTVETDADGIASLSYKNTDLIVDADSQTDGSVPSAASSKAWTRIEYGSDPLTVDVTPRSDHVRLHDDLGGETTYDLNLSTVVDSVELVNVTGDTVSSTITAGSPTFTGQADGMRVSTNTGEDLLVVLENMDAFVYQETAGGYVTVNMTVGSGERTMLARPADTVDTLAGTRRFLQVNATQLPTDKLSGMSRREMDEMASKSLEEQRSELGLIDTRFNLTIPGELSIGEEVFPSQEARVVSLPVTVLSRTGNRTEHMMDVAVWQ